MTILNVLAICGKKQVGKNTAASALIEWGVINGCELVELSFAEPIKRCVADLFEFSNEQVNGNLKEVVDPRWENKTPRSILQFFGTEIMQYKLQEILPDTGRLFWCKHLIEKIQSLPPTVAGVIITDLRFQHEHLELQKAFGTRYSCVKIIDLGLDTNIDNHASETECNTIRASITVYNRKPEMTVRDFQYDFVQNVECVFKRRRSSVEMIPSCRGIP